MDLIYTDENRVDIGVLHEYSMDIAYGVSENNFELEVMITNPAVLKQDSFVYFDNTEYGGIIDAIEVDTENKNIVYSGRSWHGILENKVLEPDNGCSTLILNGEVHTVIGQLITKLGLTDIFRVSDEDTEIEINSYEIVYGYAYTTLREMLAEYSLKLKMAMRDGYVLLYVEPVNDYSQDEEFDTSQIDYALKKTYNMTNHMICRGIDSGEDYSTEYVIHIFTDENGGVQEYTNVDLPIKDVHYIVDKSKQLVFGEREITKLLDNDSISAEENYELLDSQPADWRSTYTDYYTYNEEEDKYEEIPETKEDVYTLLTSQPANWGTNFASYYKKDGDNYESVQGNENTSYTRLRKRPSDWKTNYGNYYYYFTDGVTREYKQAEGISHNYYKKQTKKPTDWNSNYGSYYRKATAKELKKNKKKQYYSVEAVEKKETKKVKGKDGKYKTETKTTRHTPKWVAKKYYTQYSYETAPNFSKKTYYKQNVTTTAPTFTTNTYYSMTPDVLIIPDFKSSTYYKKVLDHYAKMVEKALEELKKEAEECDEIQIDLDVMDKEYDIGDIVGANEPITDVIVFQPITKKIIKLEEDSIPTISYEVGNKE